VSGAHVDGPTGHYWHDLLKARLPEGFYDAMRNKFFPAFAKKHMSSDVAKLLINQLIIFRARCPSVIQNASRKVSLWHGKQYLFDRQCFQHPEFYKAGENFNLIIILRAASIN